MKTSLLAFAFLLAAPAAWAEEPLLRTDNCNAWPTADMRRQCENKRKDNEAAHAKEQQRKQRDAAAPQAKRDSLCFTRKATQELVCPN